jgi:uncharacterized protein YbcC (UPF0753/DUF2309 family)
MINYSMNTTLMNPWNNAIKEAVERIPPLWPLSRFVAVNPFVGLSKFDFSAAASLLKKATGSSMAMPPSFYRERYHSELIAPEDLKKAVVELSGSDVMVANLLSALESESWESDSEDFLSLPSSWLDRTKGSRWGAFITEEISKWCTAYFDDGQALWSLPWKNRSLFAAWKSAASLDYNPAIMGIAGWRKLVATLSEDPLVVIGECATQLCIGEQEATDVFHALLLSIAGWAGHLQFLAHEKRLKGEREELFCDLLAIRIVYELALQYSCCSDKAYSPFKKSTNSPLQPQLVWQRAHECAMQRLLFAQLSENANRADCLVSKKSKPLFQAVFCIDVRSEVYRRSLEEVAPEMETIGFAGFFGFPIEVVAAGEKSGAPQCPVLLSPSAKVVKSSQESLEAVGRHKKIASLWKFFKSSAVCSFIFVEVAGLGFFFKILQELFHRRHAASKTKDHCHIDITTIPLEHQISMAAAALRHMGFPQRGFARLILFCGHGGQTDNNPYGSSLDCGACGGHTGEANARTAASILNGSDVRLGLAAIGILIPEETRFIGALHNTTTDEVTVFEEEDSLPLSHQKDRDLLLDSLAQASIQTRKRRALQLGLDPSSPCLKELIEIRSRDWSQVRPEWGLAGNYAFIVAPRERTRNIDLKGRVFLHDYCYESDQEEATLELLLSAPVVVASWINLQYYGSTVDNRSFGSGDKTLHNVAGRLAVFEGNGGDIRTGLPWQSLHNGKNWVHEPLRLHVCIEAPAEAIDRILKKHPSVACLVANKWIYLFAMSKEGREFLKSDGQGGWRSELSDSKNQ